MSAFISIEEIKYFDIVEQLFDEKSESFIQSQLDTAEETVIHKVKQGIIQDIRLKEDEKLFGVIESKRLLKENIIQQLRIQLNK